MKVSHQYFELVGMVVVLPSIGWQVFAENPTNRMEDNSSAFKSAPEAR